MKAVVVETYDSIGRYRAKDGGGTIDTRIEQLSRSKEHLGRLVVDVTRIMAEKSDGTCQAEPVRTEPVPAAPVGKAG